MKFIFAILLPLVLTGCMAGRVAPGKSFVVSGDLSASVAQSQDPQAATTQTIETDTVTRQAETAPGIVTETHRKISTTIGAAQKNTAQEIAAKLASIRWLQWLGVIVALFGVASIAYPPLKLIVASVTTSAWCIASGAAMVFLPLLIVGHEILIMGVTCGVAGLWFLAHRHGSISGELAALKSKL